MENKLPNDYFGETPAHEELAFSEVSEAFNLAEEHGETGKSIWREYEGDLDALVITEDVLRKISARTAKDWNVLPYRFDQGTLYILTNKIDVINDGAALTRLIQKNAVDVHDLDIQLIEYDPLRTAMNKYYNAEMVSDTDEQRNSEASTLITQMVESMFTAARDCKASDIHLTPTIDGMTVRFRVNSKLVTQDIKINNDEKLALVSVIKSQAKIETTKNLIAQDGVITRHDIEYRVNTYPCAAPYGEKVAIRLQDKNTKLINIREMGFDPSDIEAIEKVLHQPDGVTLLCGPTGQGKSTTLLGCLREYSVDEYNILTIEDPVEQHIEGVAQASVNDTLEKASHFSYSEAIRAAMRQDPDILMVGEIRDNETAKAVAMASQTGHKVFSTLHAKSVVESILRMRDLGVNPRSLLWQMNCIASQRLVGLNCPHCKQKVISQSNKYVRQCDLEILKNGESWESKGCQKCFNTGIVGRKPILEILLFTNAVRDFFTQERSISETAMFLKKLGFRSMWEKGMELVASGDISLAELCSVLSPDDEESAGNSL